MGESALWFAALLSGGAVAFALALRCGRSRRGALAVFGVAGIALVSIVWLQKNPAFALALAPSRVLIHLEGTALFPVAMAILGAAWAHGQRRRQRVLTGLAMVVALGCFLHGARWMVQKMPQVADRREAVVAQSTDYSCVAAACATALNKLNVPTSEADMVALARVRRGSGSTMLRALDGLNRRLEATPWRARLAPMDGRVTAQTPALVALRLGRWNSHLVTIIESSCDVVVIADPVDGVMTFPRAALADHAERTAIVFERVGAGPRVAMK